MKILNVMLFCLLLASCNDTIPSSRVKINFSGYSADLELLHDMAKICDSRDSMHSEIEAYRKYNGNLMFRLQCKIHQDLENLK